MSYDPPIFYCIISQYFLYKLFGLFVIFLHFLLVFISLDTFIMNIVLYKLLKILFLSNS